MELIDKMRAHAQMAAADAAKRRADAAKRRRQRKNDGDAALAALYETIRGLR